VRADTAICMNTLKKGASSAGSICAHVFCSQLLCTTCFSVLDSSGILISACLCCPFHDICKGLPDCDNELPNWVPKNVH
jgi:hypothetical protein